MSVIFLSDEICFKSTVLLSCQKETPLPRQKAFYWPKKYNRSPQTVINTWCDLLGRQWQLPFSLASICAAASGYWGWLPSKPFGLFFLSFLLIFLFLVKPTFLNSTMDCWLSKGSLAIVNLKKNHKKLCTEWKKIMIGRKNDQSK